VNSSDFKMLNLSLKQIIIMVIIGIIGWFSAAMIVSIGSKSGLFSGLNHLFLYSATIIIWYPAYLLIKKFLKLTPQNGVTAISIGTATAAICDGIAMPLFGYLYGSAEKYQFLGAAWILWFVGVGLTIVIIDCSLENNKYNSKN